MNEETGFTGPDFIRIVLREKYQLPPPAVFPVHPR